jgi:imidazolonepropionase-like amidohydrolase
MTDSWTLKMKIFAITFASLLPIAAIAQAVSNQAPDRTWITDVSIISPENLDHIEKGNVLIDGGRIVRVERTHTAKKPAGATIVSGEGGFLIPGLIDSHVHLASIPGMRPEANFDPAAEKPPMDKKYLVSDSYPEETAWKAWWPR